MTETPAPSRPSFAEGTLRLDLVAGLTAAAVVLPKAMAYATVAGLPVSVGLYTAFVPMIVYSFLGTSRVLSVSSTTTLAILLAAQLGTTVPDGDPGRLITATATLTALTGLLLVAASLLRLGFVANFISAPVLTGFKAGIGLVIVLDQIPKILGIHITKDGFFRDVLSVVGHVPEASGVTVAIGLTALVLLVVMERIWSHSPAPLAIVGGGIAASWLLGFDAMGVSTVGYIPQALPSLTMPDLSLVLQLLPGAVGIALMSFTETIAVGRAFSKPGEPRIRADRELVATGAANVAGAFFGAMPAGGGMSQTAVVRSVGGQTQKASLVTAATSAATMLVLAPILGLLPHAVLAAIVIIYSLGLIQPLEFAEIRKVRTLEFRWALAAFLGVLVLGTLQGIVVAIILSFLGLAAQVSKPRIHVLGRMPGRNLLRPVSHEHPDDETFPNLLILRPEGRLFFANAQQVGDQVHQLVEKYTPRVLVLDLSRVFDIEYSALRAMSEGLTRLRDAGVKVWLAGLNPDVLQYVRASGLADEVGEAWMFRDARDALAAFLASDDLPMGSQATSVGPSDD
jgi:sulfate permease, SulP family